MKIELMILASLLFIAVIGSGIAKLLKFPAVMTSMKSVGVPTSLIPILAILEISGGVGLVIGIWSLKLGIVSAVCLALYFLGAFLSHLRNRHGLSDFGAALFLFLIAILVTVLEIKR